jgi:hypothetical protein
VRWNAEEDLAHELVHQCLLRRRPRRHAALRGSELGFGRRSCVRWIGAFGAGLSESGVM